MHKKIILNVQIENQEEEKSDYSSEFDSMRIWEDDVEMSIMPYDNDRVVLNVFDNKPVIVNIKEIIQVLNFFKED